MPTIGPEVTLAWTKTLFVPEQRKGKDWKSKSPEEQAKVPFMFSVTSLVKHEHVNTPGFKALMELVEEVAIARFGKQGLKDLIEEGKFDSPFKRDIKTSGYDPDIFKYRINSSCGRDYPPVIRARDASIITDASEIYPGVRGRLSYEARAYGGLNTGWTPGVSLDLRNVQKIGNGPRLSTGGTNGTEFGAIDGEDETPDADMAGMLG